MAKARCGAFSSRQPLQKNIITSDILNAGILPGERAGTATFARKYLQLFGAANNAAAARH